jgi:uncharacterized protein (TIGR02246 family)
VTSGRHNHEDEVRALYAQFLDGWNRRSGAAVSAAFADDGDVVGFDGTHHSGRLSIASDLRRVFTDHPTPAYVAVVRSVRALGENTALLLAHAGMVPPGGADVDPALHTVHSVVAVRDAGRWKIGLLQSTPAAWHGRPEARDALTAELRALLGH